MPMSGTRGCPPDLGRGKVAVLRFLVEREVLDGRVSEVDVPYNWLEWLRQTSRLAGVAELQALLVAGESAACKRCTSNLGARVVGEGCVREQAVVEQGVSPSNVRAGSGPGEITAPVDAAGAVILPGSAARRLERYDVISRVKVAITQVGADEGAVLDLAAAH